jgi:amino acid transporter
MEVKTGSHIEENNTEAPTGPKKFGTFQGVFTPTTLTILGVIMYLREGWVVGNAGLMGAILIILLASGITFFTSLSMSSITTNIRIKAGGAFSIISQSLGLEAGGAIGIPLYLAQTIAVTLYIFGFREGWLWIFNDHSPLIIDLVSFALIFGVAYISTDFAFKIQYIILAIIFLSLISVGLAFIEHPAITDFQLFGKYPGSPENRFEGTNFWLVFAVYFPAVTGVMAGANMSGDLKDPRFSIPRGTLSAVIMCTVIYIGMAIVLAMLGTPDELVSNYNILIDKAFWSPIVIAGLLGATFSSALSSLVGAPRILYALGANKILFKNEVLARTDQKGEPKNALYLTSIIVLFSLLLRDLNAIAPLLTMFFLITYAMINVVVLIEQGLSQVSFRPTFKVPIIIPLLGSIGCFFAMFIINATVSFISVGLVVAAYILLMRRRFANDVGDSRSGLFNALAEWSAKMVNKLPVAEERSWQPNMIVPAQNIADVVRSYKILFSLANPKGSIKILGFAPKERREIMTKRLFEVRNHFMQAEISSIHTVVEGTDFLSGMIASMQAMRATFFRPNTIFLSLTDEQSNDQLYFDLLSQSKKLGYGAYLYIPYKKVGLGLESTLNLWIKAEHIINMDKKKPSHFNLSLLTAYILRRNWKASLSINIMLNGKEDKEQMEFHVQQLYKLSRLPISIPYKYWEGGLDSIIQSGTRSDLNITYMLPEKMEITKLRRISDKMESSFLFTFDSGIENAFA